MKNINLKKIVMIASGFLVFIAAIATVINLDQGDGIVPMAEEQMAGRGGGAISSMPAPAIENASGGKMMSSKALDSAAVSDVSQNVDIAEKKTIKDGSVDMKVSSIGDASSDIANVAKNNGGEVFSSNVYTNVSNIKAGSVVIRVPFDKFDKAFSEIKKIATQVVGESTSAQDVTQEYIDLEARLKNKQAEEQMYVDLLGRAQKIEDILAIDAQLSGVRGEIESLQGQKKFMDSQTDIARIFVSLTEDANVTYSDSWRPWQIIKDTVNGLIRDIQKSINVVIVLLVRVIPVFAIYILIAWLIYWAVRKVIGLFKKDKAPEVTPTNQQM